MDTQDSVYARRPWSNQREQAVTTYLKQWTDRSTDTILMTPPPVPNVGTPPKPRFGYRRHVPGIRDIARLEDIYPGSRVDFSGRAGGYSATQTPALTVM